MVPLDQRRRLVNAAAISVAYVCLLWWQRSARAAWRVMAMPGSCRSLTARTSARGFQIACEKPFEECSTGLIDLNDSVPGHETPIMEVAFMS